ncbi:MAG: hypothetical protein LUG83_05975 [Lachnospiraceae bacterium]|nr:hypothetical protein [Lachnospiraceae bacterium]
MNTMEYLDHLLLKYSNTFDIYMPYVIKGREYPAYGHYFSHVERYVLMRKANMWSTHTYEHILFMDVPECTTEVIDEAQDIIENYMEPQLVRRGGDTPEENHMSSYMNVIIIAGKALTGDAAGRIKKYKFEKGYNFNLRGFSRGNIACVSIEDKKFVSNRYLKDKRKLYEQVFTDMEKGRPGFKEVCERTGSAPFKQGEEDMGVEFKRRR